MVATANLERPGIDTQNAEQGQAQLSEAELMSIQSHELAMLKSQSTVKSAGAQAQLSEAELMSIKSHELAQSHAMLKSQSTVKSGECNGVFCPVS